MGSLHNKRVLVTRPQGRASRLAELLAAASAEPILIPTIELQPPASFCALDAALTTLRSFDWLIFTSAHAVEVFAARAHTLKLPASARRVAAIGPATAAAILAAAIAQTVDLVPPQAVAESFAEALLPFAPGSSMLLVRAAIARDYLPEALTAAGAQVTIAEAYRNVIPSGSVAALQRVLTQDTRPLDAVTFTSASTADNLHRLLEAASVKLPSNTVLASIGPITSQAMRSLGWQPSVEAAGATIESLVEALGQAFT